MDNTIKSDLIKHLIRERDKATIDYWANIKFNYQVSIEDLIQELIGISDSIKRNLDDAYSDKEIPSMHDKIFAILTDRDFKFEDPRSLERFISAYRDNTTAMGLITNEKLSNITNRQLELIAMALNDFLPHVNPSEKENIQRVIDIIDQKLHPIFFAIKSPIKYLFSFF